MAENKCSSIKISVLRINLLFIIHTQTGWIDSLHKKCIFMFDSDLNNNPVVEIFQSRWFVTYFRWVFFTPGRQCQSICIIYQHLRRSLAMTKYLDCGSICHCRAAVSGLALQGCLYFRLLSGKTLCTDVFHLIYKRRRMDR